MSIIDAVKSGDLDEVKKYLKLSTRPLSTRDCNAALQLACKTGMLDIVTCLLEDARVDPRALDRDAQEYSPNPHITSNWALQVAIENGHFAIFRKLMEDKRTDPAAAGNRPLELAARHGRKDIVDILLENERVNPVADDCKALRASIVGGHIGISRRLLAIKEFNGQDFLYKMMPTLKTDNQRNSVNLLLADYAFRKSSLFFKYKDYIPAEIIHQIGSKLHTLNASPM